MNYLVLLAGGSGTRINNSIAKQHIVVEKHQILEYTLRAFSNCNALDEIIVVSNVDYISNVESLKKEYNKLKSVIPGGKTRIESVHNAVVFLSNKCNSNDKVIISDAARPCITLREINEILEKLHSFDAVTTGIESYETILKTFNGKLCEIIDREGIVRQTSPEGYKYHSLRDLYIDVPKEIILTYKNIGIDQLFSKGIEIGIVKSNPLNFKITTSEDIELFENVVRRGFDKFVNNN